MKCFFDGELLDIEGRKYHNSSIMSMFSVLDNIERENVLSDVDLSKLADDASFHETTKAADKCFDYFCNRVIVEFYKKRVSYRCRDLNIHQVRSIAFLSFKSDGIFKNYSSYTINHLTKKQLMSILEIERRYKYYLHKQ